MAANHVKMDERVFEAALRNKLPRESVKILKVSTDHLSEKGLNFLSDMYRVTVRYTVSSENDGSVERSLSMVMKTEPVEETPRDLVHKQELFQTELKVLRDVLPRVTKATGRQIGPELFYASEKPPVLLMEDLSLRGFIIKDRQVGLSLDHCRLVIQKIATLHAGSVAVLENNPELIECFKDSGVVSSKCPRPYLRLMEVSLLRVADGIRKWSDEKCSRAADKLVQLSPTIGSRCTEAYDSDPDEFSVLNHGDCWINNIMFQENEKGEPVDLLLVDYQMSVYSSPAIDLLYFLNICPNLSTKYDNDDHLLDVYLRTLRETMQAIGCKRKGPSMEELKRALHKRRIYAVFAGIVLYLRMMAHKEDTEDFTEVLKTLAGETKMDVFRNPDAVKLALKMIPIMDERGYLD